MYSPKILGAFPYPSSLPQCLEIEETRQKFGKKGFK
jgi:hypothetical protein